jgi:hypothetical protein
VSKRRLISRCLPLLLLVALAFPAMASAGKADFSHDTQRFKEAAIAAYQLITEDYTPQTLDAITGCDFNRDIENGGGEPNWQELEDYARDSRDLHGVAANGAAQLLTARIKAFSPWNGKGKFDSAKREAHFEVLVRNFARDVSGYETVVKQLDLANTFVIGHDCGGARAQYDLAVAGAELSRQHVYYHLNKIQAFVKKFVS